MRKLSFTLLVLFCFLQIVNAQTLYWNGATPTGTSASGGTGTWNTTTTNWLSAATSGTIKAWVTNDIASFGTPAGVVTVGANVSANGLTFGKTGYTLSGTSTITLTGTPSIALGSGGQTETINAPVSASGATGLLTISGTGGPVFTMGGNNTFSTNGVTWSSTGSGNSWTNNGTSNFAGPLNITATGSSTINFNAASVFSGLVTLNGGTPIVNFSASNNMAGGITFTSPARVNANAAGALGTSGNAGTITIPAAGSGSRLSTLSGAGPFTCVALNTVSLNPTAAANFTVSMGATTGTNAVLNWQGQITGTGEVFFGNNVTTGAQGSGFTVLSNNSSSAPNNWTGPTVLNFGTAGYLQIAGAYSLPANTQLIYGNPVGTAVNDYGYMDLNGQTVTIGSLESAIAASGSSNLGLTNTSGTAATLVIQGGGTSNTNATYAGVIGTNANFPIGTNNSIAVTMQGSAGVETFTGANTYTGATTVNAGTLFVNNTLASTSISVGASGTIGGTGTAAGTLSLTGTVSPGATGSGVAGNFTTGAQTWNAGAIYTCDLGGLPTGTAGTNWDLITSTAGITFPTSGTKVSVNVTATGVSAMANYTSYSWRLITAATAITTFNASNFNLNVSGFPGGLTGSFSLQLDVSGKGVDLIYTPLIPILVSNQTTLSGFTTVAGTPSYAQHFNLSGANLDGSAITVSVPAGAGYEITLDTTTTYSTSITLTAGSPATYATPALSGTSIYVRIAASASAGTVSSTATNAGGNTTTEPANVTVTLNGLALASPPTTQATNVTIGTVTTNSFNVSWTNGNGADRVVVVRPVSATNVVPPVGTDYTSTQNLSIASAPTTGTNNFVVYAGTGNGPITVTGLASATNYSVEVYEYNGSGSTVNYLTTASTVNPNTQITDTIQYFWNGAAPTGTSESGGAGNWDNTTTNWLTATSSGINLAWPASGNAIANFDVTGGVVTMPNFTITADNSVFTASNYTLTMAAASTSQKLSSNILLSGTGINLNLNTNNNASFTLNGSVNGTASNDSLVLSGAGLSSTGNGVEVILDNNSSSVNVPSALYLGTSASSNLVGYVVKGTTVNMTGGLVLNGAVGKCRAMLGATSGNTFNISGQITGTGDIETANGTGLGGAGTINLTNTANNFTGNLYMAAATSFTIKAGAGAGLGSCVPSNMGLYYTTASQGGVFDINGSNVTIGALSQTAASAVGKVINNGSAAATLTVNQSANTSFGPLVITDGTSTLALALTGSGTLTLTGANTFSGGLSLNNGLIQMGSAATILETTLPVTFAGGGFSTGATLGYSETLGTLLLTGNSNINLGNGAHTLKFANSSALSWTGGKTLTINNWQGTAGNSGTAGQVFVGTDNTGLTTSQLAQITFTGFVPGATQLSTGEIVPSSAITTIYSQGSGEASTAAIWSYAPVGTGQTVTSLIGGFNSGVSVVVQNGHTVTTNSSNEIVANNLTINTGGEIKELTSSSATPYFIDLYGDLTVDGKLGLLNGHDSLALDINGTSSTISGSGTINLQRIRSNLGSSNLIFNADVNLWWSGTSLYNGVAATTFNVTVNSGNTVDLEGTGDVSIVGIQGASSSRGGTFTVNGTLKGIDTVYGFSTVATVGTTGFVIGSGGLMGADYVLLGIGGIGNFGFAVNTGGELNVNTVLQLQSGTFAPQGTVLMKSGTDSTVAILDNFSSGSFTGTYSGSITAQRYYDASQTYNQHYMGSPVNSPSLTQFGASGTPGYVTPQSCSEIQLAYSSDYGTVFSMHESNGAACAMSQWKVETSGNAENGVGYSVLASGAGTFSLTGSPNLNSSYTVSGLTNSGWNNTTLQNRPYESGWQLVSNPYLATLDITTTPAGFDNQIQVWNANGPYAGSYQPSTVIAPFQAFMVHMSNPGSGGTYTINASSRVITPHTFYAQNANQLNIVAKNISTGLLDQTTVGFDPAATDTFDAQIDAEKTPGALNRHTIFTFNNGLWMAKNILSSIATNPTVNVGFEPGATGTYTLTFNGVSTFDATSYIYLEDTRLNTFTDVRNGSYTFTADSADGWNRFVLHFTPPTVINTTPATCGGAGIINIQQPGSSLWNYVLTDSANAIVASGTLNNSNPVTAQVSPGTYMLTLIDTNNYSVTKTLFVTGPEMLTADFQLPGNTVQVGQNVILNAAATNAASYLWQMGNGLSANGASVTTSYAQPGVYTISLVVTGSGGCTATKTQTITVTGATGLNNVNNNGGINIWSHVNLIYVDYSAVTAINASVTIYDILGQEISSENLSGKQIYVKEIDNVDAAYFIVMVRNDDKITTRKVFITNSK